MTHIFSFGSLLSMSPIVALVLQSIFSNSLSLLPISIFLAEFVQPPLVLKPSFSRALPWDQILSRISPSHGTPALQINPQSLLHLELGHEASTTH